MAKITIDKNRCKGCFLCVKFCPNRLISVSAALNARGVNFAKFSQPAENATGGSSRGCIGCAMCAVICPDCCIEVYK